jgi:hypothetical protein
VLVVPTAIAATWLWQRRARLAAPLALGVGLTTLYYAVASGLGPDYARHPGNNERFFLILLALVGLSWTVAIRAWVALDSRPPVPARWLPERFQASSRDKRAQRSAVSLSGVIDGPISATLIGDVLTTNCASSAASAMPGSSRAAPGPWSAYRRGSQEAPVFNASRTPSSSVSSCPAA